MKKNFILIAGNPRSGTTFVGKMLALGSSVQYLDEPFNAEFGMVGVKSYFPYVSENDPDEISLHNKKLVDDFFGGKTKFRKLNPKESTNKKQYIGRKVFGTKNNYQYKNLFFNPTIKTGIIKDPTASLLSSYMAQKYNVPVLVIIRHPLATMASFKRLKMVHGVNSLFVQNDLNNDYLNKIIGKVNMSSLSPLEHNCYHWLIINSILIDFAKQNTSFKIISHEDLSNNPLETFKELYNSYNLKYNKSVEGTIKNYTSDNNPASAPQNIMHHLKRNSSKSLNQWKSILNEKEVNTIKYITYELSNNYYDKTSWEK